MQNSEASKWKKTIQTKYNTLIANKTWKLVKCLIDQYVLIAKWAFKYKQDINSNIKRYKVYWVEKGFK